MGTSRLLAGVRVEVRLGTVYPFVVLHFESSESIRLKKV